MPSRSKPKRSLLPVAIKDEKAVATRPVMLLVLGPHRSGTSLTARMLECLGAENSRNLNPPNFANPKGYFEDFDIYQFNDNILLPKLQQSWASVSSPDYSRLTKADRSRLGLQALEILRRNYTLSNPLSVLKDPRINNTLPFWLSLLEHVGFDVRFVCTVRDPVSTARSLHQRDNFSLAHGGMVYLTAWLSILPHLQERHVTFVQFDEIFPTPGKVLAKVADRLGLPLPADFEQRVHQFSSEHLDPSLRHSSLPREDVMLEPDLPPLVAELYRVLLDAAQSQNVRKTAKFVAYAERQIESLAPLLTDYDAKQSKLSSLKTEYDNAQTECAHLQSQLTDSTQQSQTAVVAERDAVTAERDALAARVSSLESAHSSLSTLHSSLVAERDDLATRLQSQLDVAAQQNHAALLAERNDLVTRHSSLVTALENLQSQHSSLVTEREALQSTHSSTQNSNAALIVERDAVVAEREALRDRLSFLEAEHSDLVTRHTSHATALEDLQSQHSSLSTLHSSLIAERDGLIAERDALTKERSQLIAERDELATRHQQLATALEDLQGLHSSIVVERDDLQRELSTLKGDHEQLSLKHNVFMDDFGKATKELSLQQEQLEEDRKTLVTKLQSLELELETANKACSQREVQHASLCHERDSLKARMRDLESKLSQTAESRDSLASQRDTLQANLEQRFKELAALATSQASISRERDSLKARMRDLESKLSQTEESRDSFASQRDTLQASLDQRFKELAELATSQASISRERDSLKARMRDLEGKHNQTAESRDTLAAQRDTLQANLDQRFKELADLAQEVARKHQQLDIAARKSQLTDGSVISVADIQIREVHNTGNHKHIAFDCYNVTTAFSILPRLAIRVVRHFDKEGIAVFRDHEQATSVLRDWVTSGKENGIPYMLLVLDDAQTQKWLANACASDFQTVLFLAEISSLSLARKHANAAANLNCESSHCIWLPVAQALVNRLASLSRVLRFDSVAVQQHIKDRGSREDFELSGVSFAGGYTRDLRFSVTRQGLRSKLSIPSDQPGSVFWSSGDSPLELNLSARFSASGIAWAPAPAQNPGSLRASWALALADNLPRLRAFGAGGKP